MKVDSARIVLTGADLTRLSALVDAAGAKADDPLSLMLSNAIGEIKKGGVQYKYICESCHGENVIMDGNLEWNPRTGNYVAGDVFDDAWCSDCQEECKGVAVAVEWKEGDPVVDIFEKAAKAA